MSSFCRRATDLIPFNIDAGICPAVVEITSRADIDAVLNDLEDQRFTGHLKMSSSSRTARGSLLLRRGKLLGCIYGQKTQLHPLPTEDSFRLLLNDCRAPGTQILLSTLNEEIVANVGSISRLSLRARRIREPSRSTKLATHEQENCMHSHYAPVEPNASGICT